MGLAATAILVSFDLLFQLVRAALRADVNRGGLAVFTAYVLIVLIYVFSTIYWYRGAGDNFSRPLSHLDAVYFAVGTFTTAGTGSISATSQYARGVQLLQEVIDAALVLFILGIVVARLVERREHKTPEADKPTKNE